MRDVVLQRALEAAGGVSRLAAFLALHPSTVSGWRRIPGGYVLAISKLTGIAPKELRPDLRSELFTPERNPGLAETQAPFAAEAEALGLDAAAIAAQAVQEAIRAEKARRWLAENADAIEAWNRWTESNELPLAEYRMF